jgi:hypothetical protein
MESDEEVMRSGGSPRGEVDSTMRSGCGTMEGGGVSVSSM